MGTVLFSNTLVVPSKVPSLLLCCNIAGKVCTKDNAQSFRKTSFWSEFEFGERAGRCKSPHAVTAVKLTDSLWLAFTASSNQQQPATSFALAESNAKRCPGPNGQVTSGGRHEDSAYTELALPRRPRFIRNYLNVAFSLVSEDCIGGPCI